MPNYYRLMLGRGNAHAQDCFDGNFVGVDFGIEQDLTDKLPELWRAFNAEFIPVYLALNPDKNKISAGLACGALWTVSKGFQNGDILLCRDVSGAYHVAEVTGAYYYVPGGILPHRRPVRWLNVIVSREDMSTSLNHSAGSIGTVSNLSRYAEEIQSFLMDSSPEPVPQTINAQDDEPSVRFSLERYLEDFLVTNWEQTELGRNYDIFEDENGSGQQYRVDTGNIDILAISKDGRELLVVELKRNRGSDDAVGQTMRYMGYVKEMLASPSQTVKGAIVALEDDLRIRRALSICPLISFYRYQVNFKLERV